MKSPEDLIGELRWENKWLSLISSHRKLVGSGWGAVRALRWKSSADEPRSDPRDNRSWVHVLSQRQSWRAFAIESYHLRAKRTLSLFLEQHFEQQAQSFQRIKIPNTQKDASMRIQWSAAEKKHSIGSEAWNKRDSLLPCKSAPLQDGTIHQGLQVVRSYLIGLWGLHTPRACEHFKLWLDHTDN